MVDIIVSGSISLFLLLAMFRWFFQDASDFIEHLKYLITPDLVSAFRGEFNEDQVSSLKVLVYLGLSIGPGLLTYFSIQ